MIWWLVKKNEEELSTVLDYGEVTCMIYLPIIVS